MHRKILPQLAALLLWLAPACADQTIDPPDPPDMGKLLERYEHPSVPLTAGIGEVCLEKLTQVTGLHDELDGIPFLFDALEAIGASGNQETSTAALAGALETQGFALDIGGEQVEGDGYMRVTRICDGWAAGPADADANGTLRLTIVFSDAGFDPVIWGEATACRYLLGDVPIELSGTLSVHTGTLFQPEPAQPADVLVSFSGEADIDGNHVGADLDFRYRMADQRVEFSLAVNEGYLLYFTRPGSGRPEAAVVGFVAANGTWTCNLTEGRCEQDGEAIDLW